MVAAYYPDFSHQVPWAADPNDVQAVRTFNDVTAMVRSIDRMPRGRQYELAQSRVEESIYTFRDADEKLNPVNSSSALYPYVQPYREIVSQAVWPKGPTANDNLLNLNNWRMPFDGSLESYADFSVPEWITGSATSSGPNIHPSFPRSGTKSLAYIIAAGTGRQGFTYNAPCVPGTQYTTSVYLRQNIANTQIIRISDQVLVNTTFNRTSASGLGTEAAPLATGGAWTTAAGTAADWSTTAATPYSPSRATALMTGGSAVHAQVIGSARDMRIRARVSVAAIPEAGQATYTGLVSRYVDANNNYTLNVAFLSDRTIQVTLYAVVAGVATLLGNEFLLGVYYNAGEEFDIDFYVTGTSQRVSMWRTSGTVVDVEDDPLINTADTSVTWIGAGGLRFVATGVAAYASVTRFSIVGSVEGTSTTATGSYQRLSVTYTATAPQHEVTVVTVGTTTIDTVRCDDFMHNVGATAGVFQTTGSTIYPMATRYIERWPRSYEAAGFVGISAAPAVDALAALAAISLPSDYAAEVAATSPDYWWPLSGGPNSTLYPDVTGNNNPPLGLNISKYGIGTLPAGGAAMGIPGGGGSTGVTFTPPSPPSGNFLAATVLGLGKLSESPSQPFVLPRSLTGVGGIWSVTVACWIRVTDNAVGQSLFYPSKQLSSTAGQTFIPIYMNADGSFVYSNVNAAGTLFLLNSGTGLSGIDPTDGELHWMVGIVTQDTAGNTFIYRYIDDVLDGANSATTASLGGPLRAQTDSLSVGATDDGSAFLAVVNGAMAHLTVWNRELDPNETARLYQAGQGFPGETSLERVERHFTTGGYFGPTRVEPAFAALGSEAGDPITTMQAPSWTGSMDLLTDTQNTITAEQGTVWAGPDGAVTVEGRASRYLRLTPDWTLGEDTAAGEIPYQDTIGFDFDPTFVFGDVTAQRPGGATATGGLAGDVGATNRRYFPRRFGLSADFETDQQAQDCADFIFYSHRAPNMRVETVTLNPAANPTLWHFALSVEIGQRIRVKRRAKAGNSGAGFTMSLDYFVENVTPRGLDFQRGTYLVDLELSPIGTGPGPTVQPWILEDSTLSVLDSTTVLGF